MIMMRLSITQKRVWTTLILLQLFILCALVFLKPIYVAALIFGVLCLIYLFWGSDQLPKAILLTLLISCILLDVRRKFLFKPWEITFILVFGILLFNRLLGVGSTVRIGKIGGWLAVFLGSVVVSAVVGVMHGMPYKNVAGEFIVYFYYLLFFAVIESNLSERWMKYLIYAIIGATIVVSFQYIWFWLATHSRAATDQQLLLNLAVPLVFSWWLCERRVWVRALLLAILVPMLFATLVTLTRMILVAVPVSLLFVLFLYLVQKRAPLRQFFYTGVATAIIVLILFLPTRALLTRQVTLYQAVQSRVASFKMLRVDPSLLGRVELASYILPRVKESPWLGTGLGDEVYYKLMPAGGIAFAGYKSGIYYKFRSIHRAVISWLDNSYLQVLWKIGGVGLLFFIGLWVVILKRCLFVFRGPRTDFERWSSIGIFVSFLTLLGMGFLSAVLVGYRFNLTLAALLGIVELQAQRIEKKLK